MIMNMSSTNRGYNRHATDYYITPQECIKQFLTEFKKDNPDIAQTKLWLDPCAGGDDNNAMSYPAVIYREFDTINIKTLDIREDSRAEIKADYLTHKLEYKPNVVITNPPFYLAKEIIQKALNDVADNGFVIMLLRLNFFGSKERKQFLQDNMPVATYVHSRRMSFTADKKTDSIEYMHAVWQKGVSPTFTKLKII